MGLDDGHQLSAIRYQPSAVRCPLPAISRPLIADGLPLTSFEPFAELCDYISRVHDKEVLLRH